MQSEYLDLIREIFRRYEKLALEWFGKTTSDTKADGSIVTELDLRASDMTLEMLHQHLPKYGLLSEENTEAFTAETEWLWVVDPVDGTASFARGYACWGLGIGLLYNKEPVEGFMCFPATQETFFSNSQGVWLNNNFCQKPTAGNHPDNRNCLLDSKFHHFYRTNDLQEYKLRSFGSNLYHMASVGLGRSEIMITGKVGIWDLAAALPLTRTQGMIEMHLDGSPLDIQQVLSPAHDFRISQPLLIGNPQEVEHTRHLLRPLSCP